MGYNYWLRRQRAMVTQHHKRSPQAIHRGYLVCANTAKELREEIKTLNGYLETDQEPPRRFQKWE